MVKLRWDQIVFKIYKQTDLDIYQRLFLFAFLNRKKTEEAKETVQTEKSDITHEKTR
jgi:hypothetical protein